MRQHDHAPIVRHRAPIVIDLEVGVVAERARKAGGPRVHAHVVLLLEVEGVRRVQRVVEVGGGERCALHGVIVGEVLS